LADASVPGQVLVKLDVGGTPLIARISGRSRKELRIEAGSIVWAQVKSVAVLR
jgi:molybdate transport system ATP-binding protein